MKTKAFLNNILWTCVALLLSLFCVFQSVHIKTANAEETTVIYTDVLEDLQKDEKFKVEDYPAKADDTSLQVIQIAESSNGELFVYVYQPCHDTKDLVANTIRLSSLVVNELAEYKDYKLTLLNSSTVFDKYLVEGFLVKSDAVLYYDIVQLTRPFDSNIDSIPSGGNSISDVPCNVSQRWTVQTVGDSVTYTYDALDTIQIVSKYVGFISYSGAFNGFAGFTDYYDSHFVAFSTDLPIENLRSAKVTYLYQEYSFNRTNGIKYEDRIVKTEEKEVVLTDTEKGSYEEDWLFWKTEYEWFRISKVNDLLENSNAGDLYQAGKKGEKGRVVFTDEALSVLREQTWVLRFAETGYYETLNTSVWKKNYSIISDVSLLTLTFDMADETYNMGVVDNRQTASKEPSGVVDVEDEMGILIDELWKDITDLFSDIGAWLLGIGLLVLGVIAVAIFAPWIFSLVGKGFLAACMVVFKGFKIALKWALKFIKFIILFPWNLIFKIFKRKKNRPDGRLNKG